MSTHPRFTGGFGRLFLLLAWLASSGCAQDPAWNVLIVTFDTTRADHLGCYGHDDARTPIADGLAQEGVLFEQAGTPIPITLPSHAGLMTGKVPFAHGVRDNGLFVLGEQQTTLAEILRQNGYRTGAAIGAFPLTAQFGIDQGFELFDDHLTQAYENQYGERVHRKDRLFFDERRAGRVNDAVLPWLDEVVTQPFFLWVHYFDPHHPHEPPAPYDQLFAHELYDGEIAYADERFGALLQRLKQAGVYDRTLVILTSDHGEGRGEHQESTHSLLIYESTLRVPLIIKAPGGRSATRIPQRVSTIDVMPTVLDWLGLPIPEDIQGQSLARFLDPVEPVPTMGTGGQTARRELYAETLSPRFSRNWGELRGLFYGDYKYIHGPRPELFDVARDPGELNDLITTRPQIADDMKARLERYLRRHEVTDLDTSVELEQETIRRLEALGYLQAGGDRVGPIEERLRQDGDPPQDHAHTISTYSQAKNLLFRNRALEARDFLLDLLRQDPESSHYLLLLAQAELKLGRSEEALALLDRLEAQPTAYPAPEDVQRFAARILLARGDADGAYAKIREAETMEPTAEGQHQLAQIHQSKGERHDQLRFLQRALELDPALTPARIDLAVAQAVAGEADRAEQHFRKALELNPFSARAHYNFGAFLVQEGKSQEALEHFQRAAQLKPDYVQAHYALVELFVTMDRMADADRHFDILAQRAPTSPETLWALDLVDGAQ